MPIQNLCNAIAQNTSYDAFAPLLSQAQWDMLGGYLQVIDLAPGQMLIDQGAQDRTLFFLESGALSVHVIGDKGQMQLAILNPGSVVGEGSFFSRLPRSANVGATGAARVWRMT
ncbi:MAG: cyclic nucleotide-binding domain-containing protein, partial [Comamonadaceae bacterium]